MNLNVYQKLTSRSIYNTLKLHNKTERIIINSNKDLIPGYFNKIKQIGIIGWGSQACAQAQNLRDTLVGSDIKIKVGLRFNSKSLTEVSKYNFEVDTMYDVLRESDLNLLLISDNAQINNYEAILNSLKPNSTLGFSHGFLLKYLDNKNIQLRDDINIIGVCPKGMGKTVRESYVENKGINSSIAIHQQVNDNAENLAIGWGLGIGSPVLFETDLLMECKSDLVGERSILLGAIQGICERLYEEYITLYNCSTTTYNNVVYNINKNISDVIKTDGLYAVYEKLTSQNDKDEFIQAYERTYSSAYNLIDEIYNDVENGSEIDSIIHTANKLTNSPISNKTTNKPMYNITDSKMWQNSNDSYNKHIKINGTVAGIYVGIMMAQVDVLTSRGHNYSEIVNESIIEATDSLNPYMFTHGIDHMVDNCSLTARIGCRKWASRFDYMVKYEVLPFKFDELEHTPNFDSFRTHYIHSCLKKCRGISKEPNNIFLL